MELATTLLNTLRHSSAAGLMGDMSNVMQLKRKVEEKNKLLRQFPSAATRMVDVAVLESDLDNTVTKLQSESYFTEKMGTRW